MRNTTPQYRSLTFVVGELSHVELEGDVHLVGELDGRTLSPVGRQRQEQTRVYTRGRFIAVTAGGSST